MENVILFVEVMFKLLLTWMTISIGLMYSFWPYDDKEPSKAAMIIGSTITLVICYLIFKF